MNLDAIHDLLTGLDYPQLTSPAEGERLYRFILESGAQSVLELGFAHGTSTCYMAAALDELGSGTITTMDRLEATDRSPNLAELLERTGLGGYVRPLLANTSYTWELMKLIQEQTVGPPGEAPFDFCFMDGAHTWETDGFAFFLIDKLLKPGGWILFDDVHWTFASSAALKDTPQVLNMPDDERNTPQILKVVGLLVLQHPQYVDVTFAGNWAWARKDGPAIGSLDLVKGLTDQSN
jgi:predicted O-methyltransferase YrrM